MADMVLLKMQNICKSFPGVKVLDQVNLDLKEGEVHALLGENGAGKSTLIKILGGIYTADSGSIFLQGKEVKVNSVMDAQKNEIRIIHQEIVLVPFRTITENMFLVLQRTLIALFKYPPVFDIIKGGGYYDDKYSIRPTAIRTVGS